jgi:hypothetical protein
LSYRPRSSLPAPVLAWLADRLAHLLPPRPPGQGGTPPLSLEVRLDAVAAVLLDGLSYRRAGPKTARLVDVALVDVGRRQGTQQPRPDLDHLRVERPERRFKHLPGVRRPAEPSQGHGATCRQSGTWTSSSLRLVALHERLGRNQGSGVL